MKKILLIEDEKILAEMYKYRLSRAGFEIILASNVKEGLKLAKEEKPDLILLDILFPEEDGIFFLKQLRKEPGTSQLLVIVFSNYHDPETKKRAFELGAKDYLIKTNYTPKEIVDKIRNCLK